MQESVIPADTKLHRAIESVGKGKLAKILPGPVTHDKTLVLRQLGVKERK
jgi:hypothetical protein